MSWMDDRLLVTDESTKSHFHSTSTGGTGWLSPSHHVAEASSLTDPPLVAMHYFNSSVLCLSTSTTTLLTRIMKA